jgi:hypothetical protein
MTQRGGGGGAADFRHLYLLPHLNHDAGDGWVHAREPSVHADVGVVDVHLSNECKRPSQLYTSTYSLA